MRFSYDLNGLLEVDMTIVATGRKQSLVSSRRPGRLTAAQVAARAQGAWSGSSSTRASRCPTRTALARADALYVELTGPARETLGQAIAIFRAAMEKQDPKSIDETRANLLDVVARLA